MNTLKDPVAPNHLDANAESLADEASTPKRRRFANMVQRMKGFGYRVITSAVIVPEAPNSTLDGVLGLTAAATPPAHMTSSRMVLRRDNEQLSASSSADPSFAAVGSNVVVLEPQKAPRELKTSKFDRLRANVTDLNERRMTKMHQQQYQADPLSAPIPENQLEQATPIHDELQSEEPYVPKHRADTGQ
jgi:hypothetical protein